MTTAPLRYLFPLGYALPTRYLEHLQFVLIFDWIPGLLLAALFGHENSLLIRAFHAVACYVAFQCHYELGYIINDHWSVKREVSPRKRSDVRFSPAFMGLCFLARLGGFLGITWGLGFWGDAVWWGFHILVVVIFLAHNLLTDSSRKVCTFYALAVSRFVAPTLFIIRSSELVGLALAAMACYANFRVLAYMESKALLSMPGRKSRGFRIGFYGLVVIVGLFLELKCGSSLVLVTSLYFLLASILEAMVAVSRARLQL